MKYPILIFLLVIASCTRPSDDPDPQPGPPPPGGPVANYNFGKVIQLTDSLRVWDANTGTRIILTPPYGTLAGAVRNNTTVNDSLVYQANGNRLLAMNYYTGTIKFNKYFSAASFVGASDWYPIIEGNLIYQAAYNSLGALKIYSVDKLSGVTLWESSTSLAADVDLYIPNPAHTATTIIANTINGPAAYNKSTGARIWINTTSLEYYKLNGNGVIAGDKYITTSNTEKAVYAFDINTGNFLWKTALPAGNIVVRGPVYVDGTTVYIQTKYNNSNPDGMTLTKITHATGAITQTIEFPTATFPIHFDGTSFYTLHRNGAIAHPLQIVKRSLSNSVIWTRNLTDGGVGGFTFTPKYIFITETEANNTSGWQRINILDPANGNTIKTFPIAASTTVNPVVVDSTGKYYFSVR
jgi:outer membrane protein assembly factor BamB